MGTGLCDSAGRIFWGPAKVWSSIEFSTWQTKAKRRGHKFDSKTAVEIVQPESVSAFDLSNQRERTNPQADNDKEKEPPLSCWRYYFFCTK